MRKTVPAHVLAQLDSTRTGSRAKPSRRKRAVKVTPIGVFDRLARALQPTPDDLDAAWV